MLIRLLTQPKLTLMPHRRVAPTMRSLISLSPVSNDRTAPYPAAMSRKCTHRSNAQLTICNALVYLFPRMTREAGVVRDKTKALEHLSDQHSRGLLPVHANSQSLGPA